MIHLNLFASIIGLISMSVVNGQDENVCLLSLPREAVGRPPSVNGLRIGKAGPRGQSGPRGMPGQCTCNLDAEFEELKQKLKELDESQTKTAEKLNIFVSNVDRVAVCSVGIKDGRISNNQISASSMWDSIYAAHNGRLDKPDNKVWIPHSSKANTAGEWIQVDLLSPMYVTGVVTQGRPDVVQWVTSYKMSYGNSTNQLQSIQDAKGNEIIFQGNRDNNSHVTNMFPGGIVARYFRLIAQSWNGHITLRLEYVTC